MKSAKCPVQRGFLPQRRLTEGRDYKSGSLSSADLNKKLYQIQREYSNQEHACVYTPPN